MRTLTLSVMMIAASTAGCFSDDNQCQAHPCPPSAEELCQDDCVPDLGSLWSPVIVASATRGAPPYCPATIAPWEAVASKDPPVRACVAPEVDGACSAAGYMCVRVPALWSACVIRDGAHECKPPYPVPIVVDSPVTICCPAPGREPE